MSLLFRRTVIILVRFQVFMVMHTEVVVLWVVTMYSDVIHQRCGRFCCLHLHRNRWYPKIRLHGITTRNITTWIILLLEHHQAMIRLVSQETRATAAVPVFISTCFEYQDALC